MYSTCLFCAHDLGANESIEHFPVGRRLAFDAAKGRLWVVCRHCERWNLTPLEERWEAIEECERAYRDTRLRVATDNVGFARLADGTELVRIGKPLRPELAAWRYGDQFGRRRRRTLVRSGSAAAVIAGGAIVAPFAGVPIASVAALAGAVGYVTTMMAITGGGHIPVARDHWFRDGGGKHLLVTSQDLPSARMVALPPEGGGWGVRIGYRDRRDAPARKPTDWLNLPGHGEALLTGPAALEAVQRILPLYNGRGASRAVVGSAVDTLVQLGGDDPSSAFRGAAARLHEFGARQSFGDTGSLQHMPREIRLALEMAANEDVERRAMEGELAQLEQAWKAAEEIAAIADDLLLPAGIPGMLAKLRQRVRPPGQR